MWHEAKADPQFQLELAGHRHAFVGRPTPLYAATRLGEHFGGAHIHLKREDLCHTGAHKLNNAVGQALLALRMGKKRVIAETGAGQHGVAVATVCARFGLECTVYMGTEDMRRQSMNVRRMKLLGAEVREVTSGTKTLKDATSEAIRDWVTNVRTTHYIIGSVVGPHPYPEMVRDLQRVIGDEAREQYLLADGKLPDVVVACVGGGSNAIGMFTAFLDDRTCALIGVEAAGAGIKSGKHAASLVAGGPACCTAPTPTCCRTATARSCRRTRSRPGLDYPGVGPGALVPARHRARRVRRGDRQGRGRGVQALHAARGHHARARAVARAAPRGRAGASSSGPAGASWSACPAAATRTWTRLKATESAASRRRFSADGDLKLIAYMMAGHPNRKKLARGGEEARGLRRSPRSRSASRTRTRWPTAR